ncbi:MalY/PatB family protein [Calidifontibacter terrae]
MDYEILTFNPEQARATHTSVKWTAYDPDVLPLWVAEMDAQPCSAVVDALTAAIARGDTGYGWGPRYSDAFAAYAADSWGWSVDTARTTVVADVMIGAAEVLREVTDPGGTIVVSSPCYDAFHGFVDMLGRKAADAPLTADGRLDFEALGAQFERARATGCSAYLMSNPANPTGTVHTREELTRLAALADAHDITVVSDEIHAPLVHDGTFTPYLTVAGAARGFAVTSASKAWNLAAVKAAIVVSGSDAPFARLHDMHTHGGSHLGIMAHVAAYTDGRNWLRQLRLELDANRFLLQQLLTEHLPAIRYTPPAATYLAWLDARSLDLPDDPATVWLRRGRVALGRGTQYAPTSGRGFARLNFATSPATLTEAVRRMESVVAG